MPVFVYGLNHVTASLELREKVAFAADKLCHALLTAKHEVPLDEVVILSTCNRTEIYYKAKEANTMGLHNWIVKYHALNKQILAHAFYQYTDKEAIQHMIQVASGLDSMVLGETQILGQFKNSYEIARKAGVTGPALNRLGQRTFSAAKRVRSRTRIGHNSLSIAAVAVQLAQKVLGSSLSSAPTLLIGAGENMALIGRHLRSAGIEHLTIANRTRNRAEKLAKTLKAEVVSLEEMGSLLSNMDIVISSTGSGNLLLGMDMVLDAQKKRNKKMLLLDLAVPRDIDPQVAKIQNVALYTIDDLNELVVYNRRERYHAAQVAQDIVMAETVECVNQMLALNAVKVIRGLHDKTNHIVAIEQKKTMARLQSGQDPKEAIAEFGRLLQGKLLHEPSIELKRAAIEGRKDLLDAVARVHQLK